MLVTKKFGNGNQEILFLGVTSFWQYRPTILFFRRISGPKKRSSASKQASDGGCSGDLDNSSSSERLKRNFKLHYSKSFFGTWKNFECGLFCIVRLFRNISNFSIWRASLGLEVRAFLCGEAFWDPKKFLALPDVLPLRKGDKKTFRQVDYLNRCNCVLYFILGIFPSQIFFPSRKLKCRSENSAICM